MPPVAELGRRLINAVRRRHNLALTFGLLIGASAVVAAVQQSEQSRWPEIRSALFGERTVQDGAGLIALDTPSRAQDAAVVPIEIATRFEQTPQRFIKKLYLIIDNNPSPVAAVFEFPGDRAWHSIATRIRVNAYTDVRAVVELSNGEIYMTGNFVKASGGCSAPALKDPAAAAAQLGRMKLILPPEDGADDLLLARLMVRHPNSSGLQFDQNLQQDIGAMAVTLQCGFDMFVCGRHRSLPDTRSFYGHETGGDIDFAQTPVAPSRDAAVDWAAPA